MKPSTKKQERSSGNAGRGQHIRPCKTDAEKKELDQRLASGKEHRKLHKQLRKYGYKVPFHKRYQELPTIISVIALIAAYAKEISHFFRYMASFFK